MQTNPRKILARRLSASALSISAPIAPTAAPGRCAASVRGPTREGGGLLDLWVGDPGWRNGDIPL